MKFRVTWTEEHDALVEAPNKKIAIQYYEIEMYCRDEGKWYKTLSRNNQGVWEEYEINGIWQSASEELVEALEAGGYMEGSLGWQMSATPFTMKPLSEGEAEEITKTIDKENKLYLSRFLLE